jgi:hypothetical protein
MPCRKLARSIERGPQVMRRQWPKTTVVHIVFARPHYLDRAADFIRQHHRVHNEIHIAVAAATETTTHQQIVQLHLISRNAKELGGCLCSRRLALSSRPNLHGIATRSY